MELGDPPSSVAAFYDDYADREWDRLDRDAHSRLTHHLHAHFLSEVLRPGQAVLDAGCGAGRFSRQCLEAGTNLTLLDISRVQLDLALEHCSELQASIAGVHQADIRDLGGLGDQTFDVVLCYGSVLCYLVDDVSVGIQELLSRVRPGGTLVLSVGSRAGVLRFAAANPKLDPARFFGRPEYWFIDSVLETGTLPTHPEVPHPARHFFTSSELRGLLEKAGLTEVELATAPGVSSGLHERTQAIEASPAAWQTLLEIEETTFREPGLLDAGEFLLARGRG